MKNILTLALSITAAFIATESPGVRAAIITDDFSDSNDTANPTWTHLSGEIGSSGQTWDASTGQYRLKAPTNGALVSGQNLGFVGSYTGGTYNDVLVGADIVEPTGSPSAVDNGYLTGLLAHSNGSNVPAGLTGYLFAYNQALVPKRIEITKLRLGGSTSVIAATNLAADLDLLNKDYRLELLSSGNTWTGSVYEIGNPIPIATASGTDVNAGGVAPFTSGFSGLFGLSGSVLTGPVDVTFDNFSTVDVPEPATGLLVVFGTGLILLNRRFLRG